MRSKILMYKLFKEKSQPNIDFSNVNVKLLVLLTSAGFAGSLRKINSRKRSAEYDINKRINRLNLL